MFHYNHYKYNLICIILNLLKILILGKVVINVLHILLNYMLHFNNLIICYNICFNNICNIFVLIIFLLIFNKLRYVNIYVYFTFFFIKKYLKKCKYTR